MRPNSGHGAAAKRGVAVFALLLFVVFARTFEHSALWHAVQKLAHPLTFGTVAWLLAAELVQRRSRERASWREHRDAGSAAVALGALTEVAQYFVGRDPAWSDVARDAYGAAAGLLAFAARDAWGGRQRVASSVFAGMAGLLACVAFLPVVDAGAAYAARAKRFPTLAEFGSPADLFFIARDNPGLAIVSVPKAWQTAPNQTALEVRLLPGAVRAVKITEPAPDWSTARALIVDVTNPDVEDLVLHIRVHDALHDQTHHDRYNARFRVPARTRHVERVPIELIATAPRMRRLDLSRVAGLAIFDPADGPGRRFLLHAVRLE